MLKKILDLLTPPERKRAGLLFFMILVMALLDALGVASILPFMAILANPELVESNALLKRAFEWAGVFGVSTTAEFLFFLGVVVFVFVLISLGFRAIATYAQLRFTLMREYSIGKRLVEGYLHQPYIWFVERHSADLGKTVLSEVSTVVSSAIMPMMNLFAQGAVAIALLALLISVDPVLACAVGLTLISAYVLIFSLTHRLIRRLGTERIAANRRRFIAINEAFSAPKEIKSGGLEHAYILRFADSARLYARNQATAQVISQLPRFALEALAFGGMLAVILYLMLRSGDFSSALPVIALYAFAGYRLMPVLQQIYGAITQLRFTGPALDALHENLMGLQPSNERDSLAPMKIRDSIGLHQVTYQYPGAKKPALTNLSLTIRAGSKIGLVGATGSGKTTTVDLILGLLEPQQGALVVDGQTIDARHRRAWQRAVGYVPQHIYLSDDTVAANIAFGVDPTLIDQEAVERAAKIASLHDFVQQELPRQYATTLGERGVRLSGGQRQRIGIARALYHRPQVLILDEASSALDTLTEQIVMQAVQNLDDDVTLILIAHRLSTVKACDQIYLLDQGVLKAQGTYDQLTESSPMFRRMAGIE